MSSPIPHDLERHRWLRDQPSPIGAPTFAQLLPRTAESARASRLIVRYASAAWRLQADLTESAGLVLTELVANAVNHARGDHILVTVAQLRDGGIHLSVSDGSRRKPMKRMPRDDDVEGRGLWLIDHLTAGSWGTAAQRRGKRVWATVQP